MIGNVETLNPGQSATVSSNVDEEQNIVYFNFGIPKGEKGDTNIAVFDNVALMKVASLKNGMIAQTLGYYNINDGGGADYKIRTRTQDDTINNMTLIEIGESMVAELQYNNYDCLNPEMLGAKGDGAADDTLVFQTLFSLNKPIKCRNSAIYGIKKCDMGNVDVELDGNGCTFLNIQLNMSESPQNIYKNSMFYLGTENDGTNYKPNVLVKNATFDGNKDNLTNLRAFWDAVFSIVYANNVIFKNVHFKDTIGTANIISNVNKYTIKNSTFTDIANRQETILSGTSRNGYEVFVGNGIKTIFNTQNVKCININDSYARCDGAFITNVRDSYFSNVGTVIEMHGSYSVNYPKEKNVNIDNITTEECGTAILYGSGNDSNEYKTIINLSNSNLIDCKPKTSLGGYISVEGVGTNLNIDNCKIDSSTSTNISYGIFYLSKNSTIYLKNSIIDASAFEKSIFGVPTGTKANITIDNSELISNNTSAGRIINTNSSSQGTNIQISNSKIVGGINGQFNDIILINNNWTSASTILANTLTGNLLKLVNNEILVQATSGYPISFSNNPDTVIISNNRLLQASQSGIFVSLKLGTTYSTFDNNYSTLFNIGGAITIPSDSKCSIHDNIGQYLTFSGTAQIAHDNIGITVNQ